MNTLSESDHTRIRQAVAAVEEGTGAKIAVVITRVSDRYTLYTLAGAALGAFTSGALAVAARPELTGRALIFVELCAFVGLSLVLDILALRLRLVPARVKQASARNLAHREFAAQLISGATDRRHILVFVSIGERYVEIIADHATHESAPSGRWKSIVDDFLATVKSDHLVEGILAAIESCGTLLPKSPQQISKPR